MVGPRRGDRGTRPAAVRRAANPLYDLEVAARPVFWVAACAGIIVFGALMGAMFVGQQFLQNVLGYSTLDAGLAILPAALCMVLVAPRSAKLVDAFGARITLLIGYAFCLLGFVAMLLLWKEDIAYWKVGLAYALAGVGVGFAGTPASHSLTGSVPVSRAGIVAIALGAVLVYFRFPRKEHEQRLLAEYHEQDLAAAGSPATAAGAVPSRPATS